MRIRILVLLLLVTLPLGAASRRRAASTDRCSEIIGPASLSFPATGGHASVMVTVNGGCSWSPVASESWIAAAPASGGISVDVAENSTPTPRTGLIHIRESVVVVTQAANENLLGNGSFDTNLSGWSNAHSGNGSATWAAASPVVAPLPISGIALLTSNDAPGVYQLSQCVAIAGSTRYEAGVKAMIPSGQASGVINFGVFEYWVPGCPGTVDPHGRQVVSAAAPLDTWFDKTITWNSDASARSVLVVIGAGGSPTPPFRAYFDDVFVRRKQ